MRHEVTVEIEGHTLEVGYEVRYDELPVVKDVCLVRRKCLGGVRVHKRAVFDYVYAYSREQGLLRRNLVNRLEALVDADFADVLQALIDEHANILYDAKASL